MPFEFGGRRMVQAGTLFGYLSAFITVVLGLAVADMLVSLNRLLRARRRVVWRPLPLLLALFIFLSLMTGFFELWMMTRWDRLGFYGLVWQVCLYVPIFLAACAVLPDEVPEEGLDLGAYYEAERGYIALLIAIGLGLDVAEEVAASWMAQGAAGVLGVDFAVFLLMNLVVVGALATIVWSRRRWAHWLAFALIFGMAHLGYSVWSIEGEPATVAATPRPSGAAPPGTPQ
jgi:hypothetical protein